MCALKNNLSEITVYGSNLLARDVEVMGYKHGMVVILASTFGLPGLTVRLTNVPLIEDTKIITNIIKELGGCANLEGKELLVCTNSVSKYIIPESLSQRIHGAIYLMPVLLGRFGRVEMGKTGGCQIGKQSVHNKRPLRHMLSVLEKFGAKFKLGDQKLVGETSGFLSATIDIMDYSDRGDILTGPLVSGATKTAILASMFCKNGTSRILNPYPKPDVFELLRFLQSCGFDITYSTKEIVVNADNHMQKSYAHYNIMSDISQIVTFASVAALHNIPLKLTNVTVNRIKQDVNYEIEMLEKIGIEMKFGTDNVVAVKNGGISPINIEVTSVGMCSDHQPFFALMLTLATEKSKITEHVWKNRFQYASELEKIGYNFHINGNVLHVYPSGNLVSGETLIASDLRSAAALIIAATKVRGVTKIKGINHLCRGYEDFLGDLKRIGCKFHLEQ